MARSLLLLALLAAAVSSIAALSCGSTLTDVVMSGCTACTEVNATRGGGKHHGGGCRKLLHRGGGGPDGFGLGGEGSALVPSCTECGGANFVLVTSNETNPVGRCACADTYGTVVTENATATINNETRTVPVFSCVKCGTGEVPLGPKSNLRYTLIGTLVLINTTATASSSAPAISTPAGGSFTSLPSTVNTTAHARRNRTHRARRAASNSTAAAVSLSSLAVPSAAADVPAITVTIGPAAASAAAAAAAAEPAAAAAASSIGDGAAAAHRGGFGGPGGPGAPGSDDGFGPRGPRPDGDGDFGGRHGRHGQCVACPAGSATTDGITCVATA